MTRSDTTQSWLLGEPADLDEMPQSAHVAASHYGTDTLASVARLRTDVARASSAMKTLLGLASARKQRMTRMKVMQEAQQGGERNIILDLDETPFLPDASVTLNRFQRMLDNHIADDEPAPRGCSEEILNPLRAARGRANRLLLDD